jgi:hypothetical protein
MLEILKFSFKFEKIFKNYSQKKINKAKNINKNLTN